MSVLENIVMLIPSLEPDGRLPAYAARLAGAGFGHIVVVDDGSGQNYRKVFDRIDSIEGCSVIHYEPNRGKGVALKTGYRWIMENIPDCIGVITADADGQHTVEDCIKLAEKLGEGKRALYLGSRDFDLPNVPPRSRSGNKITSAVFKLLYGQYLPDTQTGLRGFLKEDLAFMEEVEGDRYEYEMKVLIACARAKLPMIPVTIETVYENDNEGSHFHPVRDSWRIYKVLLGSFFRFVGASVICWLVDNGLFDLLNYAVLPALGLAADAAKTIWTATISARIVSAVLNYVLNRNLVFKDKGKAASSIWKYALLAVLCVCASAAGVTVLGTILPAWLAKIIVDVVLCLVNYRVQEQWVFRGKGE